MNRRVIGFFGFWPPWFQKTHTWHWTISLNFTKRRMFSHCWVLMRFIFGMRERTVTRDFPPIIRHGNFVSIKFIVWNDHFLYTSDIKSLTPKGVKPTFEQVKRGNPRGLNGGLLLTGCLSSFFIQQKIRQASFDYQRVPYMSISPGIWMNLVRIKTS